MWISHLSFSYYSSPTYQPPRFGRKIPQIHFSLNCFQIRWVMSKSPKHKFFFKCLPPFVQSSFFYWINTYFYTIQNTKLSIHVDIKVKPILSVSPCSQFKGTLLPMKTVYQFSRVTLVSDKKLIHQKNPALYREHRDRWVLVCIQVKWCEVLTTCISLSRSNKVSQTFSKWSTAALSWEISGCMGAIITGGSRPS